MTLSSRNPQSALETKGYQDLLALIGPDKLARITAPIEQPSGLPNEAYWSTEWLALENRQIFQRGWVFVAADGELPDKGSMKPMEVAGTPVLILRDDEGEVRAFHNVCRHRGTRLVDKPCRKASITCPYHAWNFRLDGRLRSRPHFMGANQVERFKEGAAEFDLYPIRLASWNGCHFIDLSGEAEPLEEWLSPMLRRTTAYDFSQIRWIGVERFTVKANWKLILENYMEGYHVFSAHPRLIAHAPMEVRWSGEWLEDRVFYNDYVAPKLTEGRGDGLPHYEGLSHEDRRRGLWFACLPNFAVEVFADQFAVLVSYPTAPDETVEELHLFVIGDEAATSERYARARQELMTMWHDLNLEDVGILENLQQGRKSIAFEGSLMSPAWEAPAHALARQVLNRLVG